MKTKLEQILDRCLNGREVAIWGSPSRLLLRELRPYKSHIADGTVDPLKHYVVAVTEDDLTDFEMDVHSASFREIGDYICYSDKGMEMPFEWECHGVKVGRQTYLGEGFIGACQDGYIERIGHFTSINGNAGIDVNHQMDMIFTSDDIQKFFSDENQELFKSRHFSDPAHPYATGKERITIGSDVWIGENVFINASKVTSIGDGAIIGSGAGICRP